MDIGRKLHQLEQRLARVERAPRLSHASIENTALHVYDGTGSLRGILGQQGDGTTAVNVVNGPLPPAPTTPIVGSVLGGVTASWDGKFADGSVVPLDWSRVEVHASTTAGFTPTASTLQATVETAQGGTIVISTDTPVYVRLMARNTSGAASTPSAQAGPTGPAAVVADDVLDGVVTTVKLADDAVTASKILAGSISADHLSIGTTGNLIADPSFEGALSDQRVTGSTYWTIATPGNNTPRAIQVTAVNATAATRTITLAVQPGTPGQKLWLAVDYLASMDWVGTSVGITGQWLDASGSVLAESALTTGAGTVKGAWTPLSGISATVAPAGTVQLRVIVSTIGSTAGTVRFDNAVCRIVLASGTSGARAELSPQGLLLYDDQGDEAIALATGRPNYLTLSNAAVPVATIDQDGNAGFQYLSAVDLSVGGDPLATILDRVPRGIIAIDYQASSVTSSGSQIGFVQLAFTAETERMYRVVLDCYADPSVEGGEILINLRDGGTGTPLISSPQMQSVVYPLTGGGWQRVRLEDVRNGAGWGAGLHRLLITFQNRSGPSGQTVSLFGGSSYLGIFYVEDIGPHVPETGGYSTGGGSSTPPTQSYTKTYAASWSGSYSNRSSYNSFYGNQCLQGYYSSTNGMQASLIGFPASLGTDLSGATITKAEVYLYFDHWYNNSGGTAVIKAHSFTSRPSTFSSDAESKSVTWARNQGKWVDITSVFDSTSWRGIALDPNNSSTTYYGRARGVGQANPPQLRVSYTK